jgi:hypothetical protein
MHGKTSEFKPGVCEAFDTWTYQEILSAYCQVRDRLLATPNSWSLVNTVRRIVTNVSSSRFASPDELIAAFAPFAEQSPELVRDVVTEVVRHRWPPKFFKQPLHMILNEAAYTALNNDKRCPWPRYLKAMTSDDKFQLTPRQRNLIRVLADDWVGTGNSLLDTVRIIFP